MGTAGWLKVGWSRATRGKRQVLGDVQEDAPGMEVRTEQAEVSGKAHAQEEKAATESYEKRQML